MIISAVYLYKINTNDITSFLNTLHNNNITIKKIEKINDCEYTFYSSILNKKKLLSINKDINIIKQKGLFSSFLSMFKYKTTIVAMILSIFIYWNLSNRIWVINISGDANSLIEFIQTKLNDNNIYVGAKKVTIDKLSEIQNKILYSNFDIIEYLSIKENGSSINVNFKEKRKEVEQTKFKGKLYAKKDGMIKSFDLLSGNKVVSENQYVRKGDLLVDDIIVNDYNEEIKIHTYGSVYAYTWYYSTISYKCSSEDSDATIFANALLEAKSQICSNFTNNEYIYQENVLQFNKENNNVFFKIHFTCVEDIAKE